MYLHDFAADGFKGMVKEFTDRKDPVDILEGEVLLASYRYESYDGEAFVLFARDGKLYEVNASHCSCYGLEGQWEPEETSVVALRARMKNGHLGAAGRFEYSFSSELASVLDQWESANGDS